MLHSSEQKRVHEKKIVTLFIISELLQHNIRRIYLGFLFHLITVNLTERLTGAKVKDIHRENIDHLTISWKRAGQPPLRISEVFDCWFESVRAGPLSIQSRSQRIR